MDTFNTEHPPTYLIPVLQRPHTPPLQPLAEAFHAADLDNLAALLESTPDQWRGDGMVDRQGRRSLLGWLEGWYWLAGSHEGPRCPSHSSWCAVWPSERMLLERLWEELWQKDERAAIRWAVAFAGSVFAVRADWPTEDASEQDYADAAEERVSVGADGWVLFVPAREAA